MGASSSSLNETISSTVNKTTVDILNKNQNSASQTGMTTQEIDVSGITAVGCTLNFSQVSNVTLKTMQSITSQTSSELVSQIQASLKQVADQKLAADSSLGSQPSTVDAVNKTITSVSNDLKANLTTENINAIIQDVNQKQVIKAKTISIDPCGFNTWTEALKKDNTLADTEFGKGMSDYLGKCITKNPLPDCDMSQLTTADLVASQITTSVMSIIANNKMAQDLDVTLKTDASAKSGGIGDMIGSIFSGLFGGLFGGLAGYAGMVLSCCCCCCCCILLLMIVGGFAASSAGGTQNNNGGGGVEEYYGGGGGELR